MTPVRMLKMCDYIPVISSASNLTILFLKTIHHWVPRSPSLQSPAWSYIRQKPMSHCLFMIFFPVLGNMVTYYLWQDLQVRAISRLIPKTMNADEQKSIFDAAYKTPFYARLSVLNCSQSFITQSMSRDEIVAIIHAITNLSDAQTNEIPFLARTFATQNMSGFSIRDLITTLAALPTDSRTQVSDIANFFCHYVYSTSNEQRRSAIERSPTFQNLINIDSSERFELLLWAYELTRPSVPVDSSHFINMEKNIRSSLETMTGKPQAEREPLMKLIRAFKPSTMPLSVKIHLLQIFAGIPVTDRENVAQKVLNQRDALAMTDKALIEFAKSTAAQAATSSA